MITSSRRDDKLCSLDICETRGRSNSRRCSKAKTRKIQRQSKSFELRTFKTTRRVRPREKPGTTERSYLRKVTRFRGLTDLFFRYHLQDLVCVTRVASKNGDPVGPTNGRFRGRRYQFEPIMQLVVSSFMVLVRNEARARVFARRYDDDDTRKCFSVLRCVPALSLSLLV